MNTPITKLQIRKIKALQSRLKMPDKEYRKTLSDEWANSCTQLTAEEADRVIATLQAEAIAKGVWQQPGTGQWHGKTKHEDLSGRSGFATPKQLRLIEAIWREVSIYKKDRKAMDHALRNFIDRIAHVQELRFLTTKGAHQVIEALKTMKANTRKEKTL